MFVRYKICGSGIIGIVGSVAAKTIQACIPRRGFARAMGIPWCEYRSNRHYEQSKTSLSAGQPTRTLRWAAAMWRDKHLQVRLPVEGAKAYRTLTPAPVKVKKRRRNLAVLAAQTLRNPHVVMPFVTAHPARPCRHGWRCSSVYRTGANVSGYPALLLGEFWRGCSACVPKVSLHLQRQQPDKYSGGFNTDGRDEWHHQAAVLRRQQVMVWISGVVTAIFSLF